MFQRIAFGLMLAVVFATWMSNVAQAADKAHEGVVVSAAEGKLVMSDKDGKNEHTHIVGPGIKVSLDGKDAKLADLKKGDAVKVTTDPEGKIVSIAATRTKG